MENVEIKLPEGASDIRGMRFGKLQALFPHASTERGRGFSPGASIRCGPAGSSTWFS